MPDIKVRVTNDLYAKIKTSCFTEYQIIKLGVEYGEELAGIVKHRGEPVNCTMCQGVGSKVKPPTWKREECEQCQGTGITYKK